MSIWQKVKGFAHGAVFASVCFLMLTANACPPETPPVDPPANDRTTLSFEYIRQGTLNAFPLTVSHANSSFNASAIELEAIASQLNPNPAIIRRDPLIMYNYMKDHTERSSQFEPKYDRHLFSAYAFYPPQGDTIDRTTLGLTYYFEMTVAQCTETVSFVAIAVIRDRISDSNEDEAVSGTTVHELGHLTNMTLSGIVDCSDGQTHQSACVMMDIDETGGVLQRWCNVDRYNYTNLFCSSCASSLKSFMTGSPKL